MQKVIEQPPTASSVALPASSSSLPRSLLIDVPFQSQAPLRNWDALHEESCEEAALIMVAHYWKKESLSPQDMETEIQTLVAWEHAHGYGDDVSAEQVAAIAKEYFGLNAHLETDVTTATIERILAEGKPVIVPAAGRDLGNPYFTGEGPWYHMLVLTGYKGDTFITNDPGTRRGKSFEYAQSTLLNAVHDWTGVKEEIRTGKRVMLVIDGNMNA